MCFSPLRCPVSNERGADETRTFGRVALSLCVLVYALAMVMLILLARQSALRVITDVKYPLLAYLGIAVTCLVCMVLYSRRANRAGAS
jgi:multidrug transporter EmrE-like cation transporter